MLKIGVTGGIGSGKSLVCRIFEHLGVPVFNADEVARDIVNAELGVVNAIKQQFGEDIYVNQRLDRIKMASLVFQDAEKLSLLNSIVHPAVGRAYLNWLNATDAPYIVKEAAILIETGNYDQLDHVVLVEAPEEVRIQRVVARDGVDAEAVRARIRNQWTDERKREFATHVVNNNGEELLLPQVIKLHREFSK